MRCRQPSKKFWTPRTRDRRVLALLPAPQLLSRLAVFCNAPSPSWQVLLFLRRICSERVTPLGVRAPPVPEILSGIPRHSRARNQGVAENLELAAHSRALSTVVVLRAGWEDFGTFKKSATVTSQKDCGWSHDELPVGRDRTGSVSSVSRSISVSVFSIVAVLTWFVSSWPQPHLPHDPLEHSDPSTRQPHRCRFFLGFTHARSAILWNNQIHLGPSQHRRHVFLLVHTRLLRDPLEPLDL